jgi:hypothetical protein
MKTCKIKKNRHAIEISKANEHAPERVVTVHCAVGKVDFWTFWIFNFLQFAIDGKNNSKTKVFYFSLFFIFMSSYAEMSFLK